MAVKKKANTATENTEVMEQVAENEVEETTVDETEETTLADVEDTVDETEATENTTEEESGENAGITVDPEPTPDAPVDEGKRVKIKPNCNYRFYYGTTWYTLCKDVIMTVPVEVKERLQMAGKLSAL